MPPVYFITQQKHSYHHQLILVLATYSLSYVYRIAFNAYQYNNYTDMLTLRRTNFTGYSFLVFLLFFFGECIPLALILTFQFKKHILSHHNQVGDTDKLLA